MRSLNILLITSLVIAAAYAQPNVPAGAVLNSASYSLPGLPNSAIASGSIFVVFGTNLGPATLQQAQSFPLQKTLAGTSVQITAGSKTLDALMLYTSAGQIAAILPSATPVGPATLAITYGGATSAPVSIRVVASSLGVFAVNQAGTGPGVITDANYNVYSLTHSSKPKDTAILWATGLGPVSGDEAAGPLPGDMPDVPLEVYVGLQKATISYHGRSGCCAGLDQIVFQVPAGVQGCRVPVALMTGGVASNFVTLPIAAGNGACSDPLPAGGTLDLAKLAAQGTVSVGMVDLSRTTTQIAMPLPLGDMTTTMDSGSADFYRWNFATFNNVQNPFGISTFGACTVYTFRGMTASATDPLKPTGLDAGPLVAVTGPNGAKQLPLSTEPGAYYAQLGGGQQPAMPLYLDAGSYGINNGAGGKDVGAFTINLNLAQPLAWTNMDQVSTVQRSQGQLVTWSGGDPAGMVTISGSSIFIGTASDGSDTVGAGFMCTANVSAQQFTVPAVVLSALPPSGSVEGMALPTGFFGVGTTTSQSFATRGIDYGMASGSVSSGKTVTYQ